MIFGKTNNYFSPDVIAKVLNEPCLTDPVEKEHFLLMSLLYETGAHAAEILNAKAQDVRLTEHPSIQLSSSSGLTRTISLPGFLAEAVSQHIREKQLSPADCLFFREQKMSSQELCRVLSVYIRKVKRHSPELVPDFQSIHHFRISRANHLYQAGMDMEDLQDFLGHRSIRETERYIGILYH